MKWLYKIINTSCRSNYKFPKKFHTSEFLKNMKWMNFKERSKYKSLCIIHTAIYK